MGCNIAKQRRDTETPTLKPTADHKLEQIRPLSRASTIRQDDNSNKFDSEGTINPSSGPLDSNKQIGSDNDNIDKNTSMANLNQPNNIEFSFKGASSEIQGLDRGGDSILPITRTNSESNRAHSFAVVKPSPFLLEKRNSEKNFYMKKTFGNQDDLLEKTATFLDSSLTTSKVLQDSETFNFPKKSETPNPDQDKIKNLMVIPQEEMTSIVESEVSRNFTKQNTLESIKAPSKLGSENSNRTEAQSNRTDSGNDKTNPATKQSSEIENQSSGSKSLGKPGIFLPLNTMQKNLLEKKKSNDAVLVLPPSDSLPRDGNNNNVDRNPIKTELKFRVNLLELVRKPDNEYSKKESNSTAEDEINEHNPSKRLLPPLENKPVVNHNGFPRKNLISFARAETTPSNNNHTINVPTTPVHNGTPTTIVIDTLSPPTKPTSSALHINLIDVQNKQPYFDGMTPITPVDTSFNKSIFDRSILLDVNNISRYDPDQISVNYDINHVQYDETEQQPRNLLQNERSPNKKFSKSKTAFREPEIKSYTSLAPENNEPTSMNSLSPMAAHSRVPNIGSINFLHSPKSAAITPSSRFARQQLFTRTKSTVVETEQLTKTKDKQGQKKINQYTMIKEIGRGGFGKVKLAIKEPDNNQFAVKIANKRKLKKKLMSKTKSAFTQLQTEIAIMKKMDHPNIVKLYEVIDDQNEDKLYLVMEFVKKGAVMSKSYWKSENVLTLDLEEEGNKDGISKKTLTEDKAKRYFRHLILGLDYLHNYVKVIHRDIKPENLLINDKDVLKISDFGISHIMEEGTGAELNSGAGTKFFMSPEAWEGKHDGMLNDIWACGGTLYYFFYGKPPFMAANADDLKRKVQTEELTFPETPVVSDKVKELISACLAKDFRKRITLLEIMAHSWVTDDGANPLENEFDEEAFQIKDEDCERAFTAMNFRAIVTVSLKMKKNLLNTRRNIERQRTGDMSQIMNLLEK